MTKKAEIERKSGVSDSPGAPSESARASTVLDGDLGQFDDDFLSFVVPAENGDPAVENDE